MTRLTHIVVACALLLAVGAVPAFSDQACKSGDVLLGTDTGANPSRPGGRPADGFCTAGRVWGGIGGTGAMAGATGQFRLRGEFSAAEGTTSGDYIGTLCTP